MIEYFFQSDPIPENLDIQEIKLSQNKEEHKLLPPK